VTNPFRFAEAFYALNHRPAVPAARPTPSEHVWTMLKSAKRIDCELRSHGESYGWECVCLYDGELVYGRRFVLKAGAISEADAQRQRLTGEGWRAENP
jgi:hypothetical protein